MSIDYTSDDYPRMGCMAKVRLTPSGWSLDIEAPNGAPMESYFCVKTPADIGRMVTEWADGKVPRIRRGGV